jgi:hypothetical protein
MNMDILIATHNKAKLARYKSLLRKTEGLNLVSLEDLGIKQKIEEPFGNAKENAMHKAKEYAKLSDVITLAVDEAVTTDFLPNDEQPGVYVRRFSQDNKELGDKEVISIWNKIIGNYPQGDKKFIWDFSIAYFNPKNGMTGFSMVECVSYVTPRFSEKIDPGYPMSSFLSVCKGGLPYSEVAESEKRQYDDKDFASFVSEFFEWIRSQPGLR